MGGWLGSGIHAKQEKWPKERVHGWAPGDYTCTCRECGIHYAGEKRSVQCYPCAEKFIPPPRPETLEEKCDRIASELAQVREELETARNALRGIWPFVEEDDGGFATPAYQKAINDARAALAMTEDANP